MRKPSSKERSQLWTCLRKEDVVFEDLCNERDKIVRLIEHHEIVKNALYSELEKWDAKIDVMFSKKMEKEIKLKINNPYATN